LSQKTPLKKKNLLYILKYHLVSFGSKVLVAIFDLDLFWNLLDLQKEGEVQSLSVSSHNESLSQDPKLSDTEMIQ